MRDLDRGFSFCWTVWQLLWMGRWVQFHWEWAFWKTLKQQRQQKGKQMWQRRGGKKKVEKGKKRGFCSGEREEQRGSAKSTRNQRSSGTRRSCLESGAAETRAERDSSRRALKLRKAAVTGSKIVQRVCEQSRRMSETRVCGVCLSLRVCTCTSAYFFWSFMICLLLVYTVN